MAYTRYSIYAVARKNRIAMETPDTVQSSVGHSDARLRSQLPVVRAMPCMPSLSASCESSILVPDTHLPRAGTINRDVASYAAAAAVLHARRESSILHS